MKLTAIFTGETHTVFTYGWNRIFAYNLTLPVGYDYIINGNIYDGLLERTKVIVYTDYKSI